MDDVIRLIFGETASELIYGHMERQLLLRRQRIGEKIEAFHVLLERLLGSEGAEAIQASGLRRLYLRLQREYAEVEAYFSLLDELYEVKFRLLASPSGRERSACD